MKIKILLIFILSFSFSVSNSQICDSLLVKVEDKFEPNAIKYEQVDDLYLTNNSKDSLYIFVSVNYNLLYFSTVVSKKCVDRDYEISFLLRDKTILKYPQINRFNCSGTSLFEINRSNEPDKDAKLYNEEIVALRIETRQGVLDYDLTEYQTAKIKSLISCAQNLVKK